MSEKEAMELYQPEWQLFFPKGAAEGGYTAMKFWPETMELSAPGYQLLSGQPSWLPHRLVPCAAGQGRGEGQCGCWALAGHSAPL